MTYHWIVPFLAAVASLTLAIVVNRIGPRTMVRNVFTFLAVTLAFWNLLWFVFYSVSDYELAFYLTRFFRSGAIFLFPAILHLSIVLPARRRSPILWAILVVDYTLVACLVIANALDLFVSELQVSEQGYYSVGTRIYDIFTAFVVANFSATFVLLTHEYRTTKEPRMRLQLKFWLLALAAGLPLGLTNLLPVYGIPFYPLGNLGSAAWAAIVAYAIVRHRLMDIEVVLTKGIAYAGVAILLLGPAFATTLTMQRLAFGAVHYDFSVALLLLLFAVGLLFPVLRVGAESRLERSLFRQKYRERIALAALGKTIVRILDRDRLVRELCDTLSETFQLDCIALFLLAGSGRSFEIRHALGVPGASQDFTPDHPFPRWLLQRAGPTLRDEVEAQQEDADRKAASSVFRANAWEVCVPLVSSNNLIGFLGLGRKRTLNAFSAGDLDVLDNIAAGATIALENARLYEELRRSKEIIQRESRLSAIGTLAAGIAHEIRNPLVSVQTFFQLAPERLHDEEFMSSFLRLTENEVHRISNLITELLTFAKSSTHTSRHVNLKEEVASTLTLLAPEAHKQQVRLEQGEMAGSAVVYADADQIKQVMINVVLNALQATPPEGVVTLSLREIEREERLFWQIEVGDTGSGIPAENREDIFNPFFTTKSKGSGLGLSIAHQIISEHGGFITVESEEGKGSKFFIHLEVASPEDEVLSRKASFG